MSTKMNAFQICYVADVGMIYQVLSFGMQIELAYIQHIKLTNAIHNP